MVELSPLAPVFLILAFSEIALGTYILQKGPLSPVNRLFFNLTALAAIGSVLDMLVASSITEEQAVWAFRLLIVFLIIELGVALRLISMVPQPIPMLWHGKMLTVYWLSVVVTSLATAMTVRDMVSDDFGWVPSSTLPYNLLSLHLSIYLGLMVVVLAHRWRGMNGLIKRQTVVMTLALIIPAAVVIIVMLMEMAHVRVPRMYGLGELVSVAIVAYGVLRYQLMVPSRVVEPAAPLRTVPSLVKGRAYLFENTSPDRMFESVVQEMAGGMSALIIARTHPDQLRARYLLMRTPILWLAQSPGPDRVDPANIQLLTHMTMEFVNKGPSVIALEGLEYLMVNNDLNRVLKFLGQLRDEVIVEGSILLVSIDPRTLTERQKAILERELEVMME